MPWAASGHNSKVVERCRYFVIQPYLGIYPATVALAHECLGRVSLGPSSMTFWWNAKPDALDGWLALPLDSPIASFARDLVRDLDAVRAAIVLPRSTGPVEGTVNKLTLIKRSMYGRAGLDLLRARVMA